jgi:uronate dehydrogenase
MRPNGLYGCSKVWGEALARHFADTTPTSMICLRIGHVSEGDRPVKPREFSVWCSRRDIAQAVERALAAPDILRFDVFFITSDNKWGYRDIEHARAVLGYVPEDRAEDFR